jgi:hypothetical protein
MSLALLLPVPDLFTNLSMKKMHIASVWTDGSQITNRFSGTKYHISRKKNNHQGLEGIVTHKSSYKFFNCFFFDSFQTKQNNKKSLTVCNLSFLFKNSDVFCDYK